MSEQYVDVGFGAKVQVRRAGAAKREMARILRKWELNGAVYLKPAVADMMPEEMQGNDE